MQTLSRDELKVHLHEVKNRGVLSDFFASAIIDPNQSAARKAQFRSVLDKYIKNSSSHAAALTMDDLAEILDAFKKEGPLPLQRLALHGANTYATAFILRLKLPMPSVYSFGGLLLNAILYLYAGSSSRLQTSAYSTLVEKKYHSMSYQPCIQTTIPAILQYVDKRKRAATELTDKEIQQTFELSTSLHTTKLKMPIASFDFEDLLAPADVREILKRLLEAPPQIHAVRIMDEESSVLLAGEGSTDMDQLARELTIALENELSVEILLTFLMSAPEDESRRVRQHGDEAAAARAYNAHCLDYTMYAMHIVLLSRSTLPVILRPRADPGALAADATQLAQCARIDAKHTNLLAMYKFSVKREDSGGFVILLEGDFRNAVYCAENAIRAFLLGDAYKQQPHVRVTMSSEGSDVDLTSKTNKPYTSMLAGTIATTISNELELSVGRTDAEKAYCSMMAMLVGIAQVFLIDSYGSVPDGAQTALQIARTMDARMVLRRPAETCVSFVLPRDTFVTDILIACDGLWRIQVAVEVGKYVRSQSMVCFRVRAGVPQTTGNLGGQFIVPGDPETGKTKATREFIGLLSDGQSESSTADTTASDMRYIRIGTTKAFDEPPPKTEGNNDRLKQQLTEGVVKGHQTKKDAKTLQIKRCVNVGLGLGGQVICTNTPHVVPWDAAMQSRSDWTFGYLIYTKNKAALRYLMGAPVTPDSKFAAKSDIQQQQAFAVLTAQIFSACDLPGLTPIGMGALEQLMRGRLQTETIAFGLLIPTERALSTMYWTHSQIALREAKERVIYGGVQRALAVGIDRGHASMSPLDMLNVIAVATHHSNQPAAVMASVLATCNRRYLGEYLKTLLLVASSLKERRDGIYSGSARGRNDSSLITAVKNKYEDEENHLSKALFENPEFLRTIHSIAHCAVAVDNTDQKIRRSQIAVETLKCVLDQLDLLCNEFDVPDIMSCPRVNRRTMMACVIEKLSLSTRAPFAYISPDASTADALARLTADLTQARQGIGAVCTATTSYTFQPGCILTYEAWNILAMSVQCDDGRAFENLLKTQYETAFTDNTNARDRHERWTHNIERTVRTMLSLVPNRANPVLSKVLFHNRCTPTNTPFGYYDVSHTDTLVYGSSNREPASTSMNIVGEPRAPGARAVRSCEVVVDTTVLRDTLQRLTNDPAQYSQHRSHAFLRPMEPLPDEKKIQRVRIFERYFWLISYELARLWIESPGPAAKLVSYLLFGLASDDIVITARHAALTRTLAPGQPPIALDDPRITGKTVTKTDVEQMIWTKILKIAESDQLFVVEAETGARVWKQELILDSRHITAASSQIFDLLTTRKAHTSALLNYLFLCWGNDHGDVADTDPRIFDPRAGVLPMSANGPAQAPLAMYDMKNCPVRHKAVLYADGGATAAWLKKCGTPDPESKKDSEKPSPTHVVAVHMGMLATIERVHAAVVRSSLQAMGMPTANIIPLHDQVPILDNFLTIKNWGWPDSAVVDVTVGTPTAEMITVASSGAAVPMTFKALTSNVPAAAAAQFTYRSLPDMYTTNAGGISSRMPSVIPVSHPFGGGPLEIVLRLVGDARLPAGMRTRGGRLLQKALVAMPAGDRSNPYAQASFKSLGVPLNAGLESVLHQDVYTFLQACALDFIAVVIQTELAAAVTIAERALEDHKRDSVPQLVAAARMVLRLCDTDPIAVGHTPGMFLRKVPRIERRQQHEEETVTVDPAVAVYNMDNGKAILLPYGVADDSEACEQAATVPMQTREDWLGISPLRVVVDMSCGVPLLVEGATRVASQEESREEGQEGASAPPEDLRAVCFRKHAYSELIYMCLSWMVSYVDYSLGELLNRVLAASSDIRVPVIRAYINYSDAVTNEAPDPDFRNITAATTMLTGITSGVEQAVDSVYTLLQRTAERLDQHANDSAGFASANSKQNYSQSLITPVDGVRNMRACARFAQLTCMTEIVRLLCCADGDSKVTAGLMQALSQKIVSAPPSRLFDNAKLCTGLKRGFEWLQTEAGVDLVMVASSTTNTNRKSIPIVYGSGCTRPYQDISTEAVTKAYRSLMQTVQETGMADAKSEWGKKHNMNGIVPLPAPSSSSSPLAQASQADAPVPMQITQAEVEAAEAAAAEDIRNAEARAEQKQAEEVCLAGSAACMSISLQWRRVLPINPWCVAAHVRCRNIDQGYDSYGDARVIVARVLHGTGYETHPEFLREFPRSAVAETHRKRRRTVNEDIESATTQPISEEDDGMPRSFKKPRWTGSGNFQVPYVCKPPSVRRTTDPAVPGAAAAAATADRSGRGPYIPAPNGGGLRLPIRGASLLRNESLRDPRHGHDDSSAANAAIAGGAGVGRGEREVEADMESGALAHGRGPSLRWGLERGPSPRIGVSSTGPSVPSAEDGLSMSVQDDSSSRDTIAERAVGMDIQPSRRVAPISTHSASFLDSTSNSTAAMDLPVARRVPETVRYFLCIVF